MGRMRFPLERETDYKGTITFRTIIEPEIDGQAVSQAFNSAQNQIKSLEAIKEKAKSGTPEEQAKANAILRQQQVQDTAQLRGLGDHNQSIIRPAKTGNSPDWVQLYLPQSISFRDGASYDNADLGGIGATAEAAIQSG